MASLYAPSTRPARPPHALLRLTEAPRAVGEFASFVALRPLLARLPAGDGHGVLVLPGFLADDRSTRPLRSTLARLGYDAVGWDLGHNLRIDGGRMRAIGACLARLHERTGRKASVIGWSLGGLLGREIARAYPERVRQVISLGTPLSNDPGHAIGRPLFDRLNPGFAVFRGAARFANLTRPPPVPSTCIYARGDGVVAWRGALQDESPQAENVAVHASHCGLAVNPLVMMVLADRLAQPEGGWRPFRPRGWQALLFPKRADPGES